MRTRTKHNIRRELDDDEDDERSGRSQLSKAKIGTVVHEAGPKLLAVAGFLVLMTIGAVAVGATLMSWVLRK